MSDPVTVWLTTWKSILHISVELSGMYAPRLSRACPLLLSPSALRLPMAGSWLLWY